MQINKISKDNYIFFLASLIPFCLVLSVAVLEFFFLIFILIYIHSKWQNFEIFQEIDKKTFISFALVLIYLVLNSLINYENNPSIIKNLFYFRFLILVCLIIFLYEKFNFNYLKFLKIFIFLLIVLSIDVIFQSIFAKNLFGYPISANYTFSRISSFFGDEYILGSFLFNFSWILFIYILKKNNFNNLKYIIIFGVFFCALFLTGERSATLKFGLFILVLFFSLKELRIFLIKTSILSSLIFFGVLFIQFQFSYQNYLTASKASQADKSGIIRLSNVVDRYYFLPVFKEFSLKNHPINTQDKQLKVLSEIISNKVKVDEIKEQSHPLKFGYVSSLGSIYKKKPLGEHFYLFNNTLIIIQKNLIFGSGLKTFRNICFEKKYEFSNNVCSTHPHNYYLETLSELGLIGFILFFILFYFIINRKFEESQKSYKIILLSFILIYLFPFQTTGSFFNNYNSFILFFFLGNYVFLAKYKI